MPLSREELAGQVDGLRKLLFCLIDELEVVTGFGSLHYNVLDRIADKVEDGDTQSDSAEHRKGIMAVIDDYSRRHAGTSIDEHIAEYCERWTDPYGVSRRVAPNGSLERQPVQRPMQLRDSNGEGED